MFKARLITRGFEQKRMDYEETFTRSKVGIIIAIGILLQNWKLWHLDVNTTFLNNDFRKGVFMEQLLDFENSKFKTKSISWIKLHTVSSKPQSFGMGK